MVFGRGAVAALLLLTQVAFLFMVFGRLQSYSIYLSGVVNVLTAVFLAYLLNTASNPSVKLTWCIIIAMVPVFGVLLYLFITFDVGHREEKRILRRAERESAPFMPEQTELMARLKEEEPGFYPLASYARKVGYPVYENTAVTYFSQGEAKYEAMLGELEKAEKFIFLEYFIVQEGEMWDAILDVLARKVREGVDVRVLYDGTCSLLRLPSSYPKKLRAMGVKCKVFAPIRPFISTSYNNRDHRKILVIDGQVGFTGGVNLADEYINRRELFGHWKDAAVMLRGEGVRSLTVMFLRLWNAGERERVYAPYIPASAPWTGGDGEGFVIPYGDSPMDDERTGELVYLDILSTARDYVYIMSPYLILDNEMLTALTFAAKRGVDVRLILPGIPDKKYANILAKSHYKELIRAGVKVYEYAPGFVHSKVFLSDGCKGVVGTINLDYRSLYLHFECAAYLYKVPALKDILADFEATFPKCRAITMEDVKNQKPFTRLAGAILKLAAPLM